MQNIDYSTFHFVLKSSKCRLISTIKGIFHQVCKKLLGINLSTPFSNTLAKTILNNISFIKFTYKTFTVLDINLFNQKGKQYNNFVLIRSILKKNVYSLCCCCCCCCYRIYKLYEKTSLRTDNYLISKN